MKTNEDRVRKAADFNKSDVDSILEIMNTLAKSISEDGSISEDTIETLDQSILELIQMRKRHVSVYMSLLKQGYTK